MKAASVYKYRAAVNVDDVYDAGPVVEAVSGGNVFWMMKRFMKFSDALQFARLLAKGFNNAVYTVDLLDADGQVVVRLVQTKNCE